MECQRPDGRAILKTTSAQRNVKKPYIKRGLSMRLAFRFGCVDLNIVRPSAQYGGINICAACRLQKHHFKKKKNAGRRVTIYYICTK
jgi:hypothetical protein